MKAHVVVTAIVAVVIGLLVESSFGEAGWSKEKSETGPQQVTGTVSYIAKDYISVVTKVDKTDPTHYREEESLIPFNQSALTFNHAQSLADLKPGDTVSVEYVEEEQQFGDQKKIRKIGRGISLIKSGTENALVSE